MRLIVVENDLLAQRKWIETLTPHWPGIIDLVSSNQKAVIRLDGPYFFPFMVCRANRETILLARDRGVQRFAIKPCEPSQLIGEINQNILGGQDTECDETHVQLQAIKDALGLLCSGPLTVRQLLTLKQRCTAANLHLVRVALDRVLSYLDKPGFSAIDAKSALVELTRYVEYRVDKRESSYCA